MYEFAPAAFVLRMKSPRLLLLLVALLILLTVYSIYELKHGEGFLGAFLAFSQTFLLSGSC